tara:strand:+ start:274 stop:414 length:141 start_codon:yes stop_codon:yes gene_type:complete
MTNKKYKKVKLKKIKNAELKKTAYELELIKQQTDPRHNQSAFKGAR